MAHGWKYPSGFAQAPGSSYSRIWAITIGRFQPGTNKTQACRIFSRPALRKFKWLLIFSQTWLSNSLDVTSKFWWWTKILKHCLKPSITFYSKFKKLRVNHDGHSNFGNERVWHYKNSWKPTSPSFFEGVWLLVGVIRKRERQTIIWLLYLKTIDIDEINKKSTKV